MKEGAQYHFAARISQSSFSHVLFSLPAFLTIGRTTNGFLGKQPFRDSALLADHSPRGWGENETITGRREGGARKGCFPQKTIRQMNDSFVNRQKVGLRDTNCELVLGRCSSSV